MRKIKEVIVVEGRYDKKYPGPGGGRHGGDTGRLCCVQRQGEGGLSPAAGGGAGAHRPDGQRRGGLRHPQLSEGGAARDKVKQAYIPDIRGKEKRKRTPGKEGKLGVEGMKPDVILEALRRAGVTFLDEETAPQAEKTPITKADLMEWGLAGGSGQQPAAAGAAAAAGFAGAPDGQRDAGSPESAGEPRKIGGTAGG